MSIFVIKNNNNIIGLYDDLKLALDYTYSLYNSKLINKEYIIIEKYKINTNILLELINVDLKFNITTEKKINYNEEIIEETNIEETNNEINTVTTNDLEEIKPEDDLNNPINKDIKKKIIEEKNNADQELIDIVHNINLLKKEKEKENEKINIYNIDIELYKKFLKKKTENNEFEIPELFQIKYSVFKYLDSNNELDYNNFIKLYCPTQIKTSYDNLFDIGNIIDYKSNNSDDTEFDIELDDKLNNVEFTDIEINDLIIN